MTPSKVYKVNEFWFVDYIDDNYELLPAVGVFVNEYEARESAQAWNEIKAVESMGESIR